jgi:hypothetical protein
LSPAGSLKKKCFEKLEKVQCEEIPEVNTWKFGQLLLVKNVRLASFTEKKVNNMGD